MKKNLVYLCMLVFAMGIFSSCNKEDDEAKDQLVGTWNVDSSNTMDMNWVAPDATISMGEASLPISSLSGMITPVMSSTVADKLQSVTFLSDGKIEATYNGNQKATGYATYKVSSSSKLILHIDADKAFADVEGVDAAKLAAIKVILAPGIPVHYTITGTSGRFYLDTETIKAAKDLIPILGSAMVGGGNSSMDSMIQALLGSASGALDKTETIEIGLHLTKTSN